MPTALAIAEIATNRRVEGGGEYFIISRSFGTDDRRRDRHLALPVAGDLGRLLHDRLRRGVPAARRLVRGDDRASPSIRAWSRCPATVLLVAARARRAAPTSACKALWVVVAVLGRCRSCCSSSGAAARASRARTSALFATIDGRDPFMLVFAIVLPGVHRHDRRRRALGRPRQPARGRSRSASCRRPLVGMVVYVAVVLKLAGSAPPEVLAGRPARHVAHRALGADHPDRPRLRHALVGDRLDPGRAAHAAGARRPTASLPAPGGQPLPAPRAREPPTSRATPRWSPRRSRSSSWRWATSTSWRASSRCSSW